MALEFAKLFQEARLDGYQLEAFQEPEEVTEVPEDIRNDFVKLDLTLESLQELTNTYFTPQSTPLTPAQKNLMVMRHNAILGNAPQMRLTVEDFDDATLSMEEDFRQRFIFGMEQTFRFLGKVLLNAIDFVKDMMDSTEAAIKRVTALRGELRDYNTSGRIELRKRRLQGAFDDGYGMWMPPEAVMPQLALATKHVFGDYWSDLERWISNAKVDTPPDSMGLNTYFEALPRQIRFQLVADRYHYLNIGKAQYSPKSTVIVAPSRSKLTAVLDGTYDTLQTLKRKQTGIVNTLKLLEREGAKLRKALGGSLRIMLDPDTRLEYQQSVAGIRVKSRLAINVVKTFAAYSLALCEYSNQYVALVLSSK